MSQINNRIDEEFNEKRLLITGVSGLVGRILFHYLMKNYSSKYYLIGTDQHLQVSPRYQFEYLRDFDEKNSLSIPSDRFIQCDITNKTQFHRIICQHRIEQILHLAAVLETDPDPEKIFKVNIEGTKNVFDAPGIECIFYVSTVRVVFGYLEIEPYRSIYNQTFDDQTMLSTLKRIRVDDPILFPRCQTPSIEAYWKSKYQCEQMIKEILNNNSKLSIICIRLGWVNIQDEPGETFYRTVWLSHRDLCSFFGHLLTTRSLFHRTYFLISNNHRLWVDIDSAKQDFNFIPEDGAPMVV